MPDWHVRIAVEPTHGEPMTPDAIADRVHERLSHLHPSVIVGQGRYDIALVIDASSAYTAARSAVQDCDAHGLLSGQIVELHAQLFSNLERGLDAHEP